MAGFDPLTALRQIDQLPVHSHFFLTELVFQEWSFRDLNDAVAHAKTLSTTQRMAAVQGILKSRDDLSSSLRDEIASQVGGEQFVLHMLAQSSKDEAIEFPEIAWDSLLGDAQERAFPNWVADRRCQRLGGTRWDRRTGSNLLIFNGLGSQNSCNVDGPSQSYAWRPARNY